MKKIIVNRNAPTDFINLLKKEGITPIPTMDIGLSSSLCTHADLQIHRLNDDTFICDPRTFDYYRQILPEYNILCGSELVSAPYPKDIPYNVLRVGETIIHHIDNTDPILLSYYREEGKKLLPVRQGYVACSVLKVTEDAVITADYGIAKAYKKDLLLIQKGGILLTAFFYGFIGGSGGLISRNKILFCGDITKHRDYEAIRDFCNERDVEILYIEGKLTDIGGLV